MVEIPTISNIPIGKLRLDNENPNIMGKRQYEALKKNIKEYGFLVPIITNKNLLIADGEHRLKAAKDLEMSELPVIRLPIDDVNRRILRQVMNKLRGQHDKEGDKLEFIKILEAEQMDRMTELLGYNKTETSRIMDLLNDKRVSEEIVFTKELMEENNYVVFVFDNVIDWNFIKNHFGLKTLHALDSKKGYERSGIGRVLDGNKLIEEINKK